MRTLMPRFFEPRLDLWSPWSPAEVTQRLSDVRAPWYVAGGWAIDLFLRTITRDHEDIEIGAPAPALTEFRDVLADCELFIVGQGEALALADAGTEELATHRQTWVRDRASGRWRLDIFREPSCDGLWVCRRDERLTMPYGQLILRDPDGIPFARPEVILLFKAKATRPKDMADFQHVLPRLDRPARDWLRQALTVAHPGHPWITALG